MFNSADVYTYLCINCCSFRGHSETLKNKNEEIKSLKRKLNDATEELKETRRVKEVLLSENTQLQGVVGEKDSNNRVSIMTAR